MRMSQREFNKMARQNPNIKKAAAKQTPANKEKSDTEIIRSKYINKKTYIYEDGFKSNYRADGHGKLKAVFDSQKEYRRWLELKYAADKGYITDLHRQVPFQLQEAFVCNGEEIRPIQYIADFVYIENGKKIVEDVKGFNAKTGKYVATEEFLLKWKMLKYRYRDYDFRLF